MRSIIPHAIERWRQRYPFLAPLGLKALPIIILSWIAFGLLNTIFFDWLKSALFDLWGSRIGIADVINLTHAILLIAAVLLSSAIIWAAFRYGIHYSSRQSPIMPGVDAYRRWVQLGVDVPTEIDQCVFAPFNDHSLSPQEQTARSDSERIRIAAKYHNALSEACMELQAIGVPIRDGLLATSNQANSMRELASLLAAHGTRLLREAGET